MAMEAGAERAVAIVGVGAILPDAPDAGAYWHNICEKRYSIRDVPAERWNPDLYYDPDPGAPGKTYSKIGSWVQGFAFDWKQYRLPPRVVAAMDEGQQWAVTVADQVLADYGYPGRPLELERTGVVLGTALGGERHYQTVLGVSFPEYAAELEATSEFAALPQGVRTAILQRWQERMGRHFPEITEDSMPGELPNIVSGRVANIFNLRGPNFIADAACASSFAAINSAVGLLYGSGSGRPACDAVLTGGVDRSMGAATFIKFAKIGALSATGTRPFGAGADGFVMGEGAALFLLKRLADAEAAGDRIYAVIRGVGASSDGKGKGITAPNPLGQQLAMRRAWESAGLDPATATLIEAHGTSTAVGDVAEVASLIEVFCGSPREAIALGSAKSNIGHLKAGAGAAGLLKASLALHHQLLPPTLNVQPPNPNMAFDASPFYLNDELREWQRSDGVPRRCGVSAYGFGGTNFHLVLEEHRPGELTSARSKYAGISLTPVVKRPVRGILAVGAPAAPELRVRLDETLRRVEKGWRPELKLPEAAELAAPERLVLDFGDDTELRDRLGKARKALELDQPAAWKALQAQGIFRGSGTAAGKIAFLYPGQGSQYANMGCLLAETEPSVAGVFAEADRVMTPILGKSLTDFIFVDGKDPQALQQAEKNLTQTAITQPAVLTMDAALTCLLNEFGFQADVVMGHSLGEYAALVAAGVLPFAEALEAAAARGREMTRVSMGDNGWMAAVMAPDPVVQAVLAEIDGYVVAANINSHSQCVIGGASQAVEQAIAAFQARGHQAQRIPVSHAFHTAIVAPDSQPLRTVLDRLHVSSPRLPLVANVTGEMYPQTPEAIKDLLEQQIASPVQWVKGLETLYAAGVRTFVEVGPKKALKGFVDDVLGDRAEVVSLFTNHPKTGELQAFNQAVCGLFAAGYGIAQAVPESIPAESTVETSVQQISRGGTMPSPSRLGSGNGSGLAPLPPSQLPENQSATMLLDDQLREINRQLSTLAQQAATTAVSGVPQARPYDRREPPLGSVVITGTGLGLPRAGQTSDGSRQRLACVAWRAVH